ncbi:hypothetical protein [Roseateles violae]|uniref:Uncharacterized protein n=1 Tax=Roseateles violae TaxID=3058042 RepID=A0ABT8DVZ8_9BURK|nr:hypothetical protein [Pelomonas sp. PFR6]MDN3922437.1 hypothetical protein [Pelomonas sp. PFR6]
MPTIRKLLSQALSQPLSQYLRDPQSWVSLIAASTLIGLCAGVFEPADVAPALDQQLAAAQIETA